jgi:hypothetical protein
MPHTLDPTRLEEVFKSIEENLDRFTQWEQRFIESTRDQFDRTGSLSDKQMEVLEKIYLKVD